MNSILGLLELQPWVMPAETAQRGEVGGGSSEISSDSGWRGKQTVDAHNSLFAKLNIHKQSGKIQTERDRVLLARLCLLAEPDRPQPDQPPQSINRTLCSRTLAQSFSIINGVYQVLR